MADDQTLLALGGMVSGKFVVERLLGPTLDYVGEGLRHFTERRVQNVQRIVKRAVDLLGDRLDEDGAVSPRVLKEVLYEGSFIDDQVAADYFGGVLASSRTKDGRDDRAAAHGALLARMSVYSIRTHYVLYTIARRLYTGQGVQLGSTSAVTRTYVPMTVYERAMEFAATEDRYRILAHAFFALRSEDLVADSWWAFSDEPDADWSLVQIPHGTPPGIAFEATPIGAELYVWAHGLGERGFDAFLSPDVDFPELESVQIPDGACGVLDLRRTPPNQM